MPSDEDWDIKVNGGEAEAELIGECFYSIKLTQGTNDITMTYHIHYLKMSIIITSLTLIFYVGYYLKISNKHMRKKVTERQKCNFTR